MQFEPPLQQARLLRRYKRFLADIEHANGDVSTIHCPNTGAMTGCAEAGFGVWYSTSDNTRRKYPHTWELAEDTQGHKIIVNTQRANQLATEAVERGVIPALTGYRTIQREIRYGSENSRIDLKLSDGEQADCFVEVKSVTLLQDGTGYFPDAITTRGQKHIRELMQVVANGQRAVLLFVVGHSGISTVRPAAHIDPEYAKLCIQAAQVGVEILALGCDIGAERITAHKPLPVKLVE